MRRLVRLAKPGDWPAGTAQGSLTLALAERSRRRIRLTTDAGEPVLLDLASAVMLAEGDGLSDDAGWLAVHAAPEDVLDIEGRDAAHLARLAWHLGNRHLPLEVLPGGRLRIAYDHVIEDMLRGLGALTTRREAPFQPEPGAYAPGQPHPHA